MTTNFYRTAMWLAASGKEPSEANVSIQIGCHIEELVEFLRTLAVQKGGETSDGYTKLIARTTDDLDWLGSKLKRGELLATIPAARRVEALDALCDCEVTGNGVAYLAGLDKVSADEAVLRSNEAKLVDGRPVVLPGGKIGKPDGWTAPDLSEFV